jgi:hypothetical protein
MQQGMTMGGSASGGVDSAIQMRPRTDEILSGIWIALPIIAVLLGLILGGALMVLDVGVGIAGIFVGSLIAIVVFAVLNYKLIDRMNEHSRREAMLRGAIIQHFRDKANLDPAVGQRVSASIATMESIQYEARMQEKEKSAALWAILPVFISILILYPLYFLTKFTPQHDRRWQAFTQQAQYAGNEMGMSIVLPSWRTVSERSFFLYLVLTLLTGFFAIYWYYVLIKDLNEHMQNQWQFEDQFAREMR